MAKPKIKHTITKKEWNKKHKDFKTTINGTPYIMMYDDKVGTHLVPVKIVDESIDEAKAGDFEIGDFVHFKSKNKTGMVKKISGDKVTIMTIKGDFTGDIKDVQVLYQDGVNEKMDLNDPIMMKLRAAQMKRNKDAAKKIDTEKQNKNAIKIKALKKKRAQVMRDMEQEAEMEGGPIADRYGKLLNRIDNDIIKLGGNPMTESINEWKLQLDLGKVNPSEFENWASDSLQKKHKIKVSGSGKNWTIVGKGNDDRMGSSADWITQLLGKAWKINKIKVVQKESINEGKKFKQVKKDKYGNHLEPQFKKGDLVTYLRYPAIITSVNKESNGVYSYNVDYNKGNGRTAARNIFNKSGNELKESVNEASDLDVYHKSYTHAIEAAEVYAKKKGYEIDDDEMFTKVGMNSKRPSVGKTTRVSLELLKNGKPQRKMLHIQVYGMKNGYELNAYIN